MWNTIVNSASTSAVYVGSALSTGITYHWRVRVYDGYEWGSWLYGGTFRLETNWMQIIPCIVVFLIFVAFIYVFGRRMFKHISIRVTKKRIKSKLIKFSKFEERKMIPFILIIICVAAARFIDSETVVFVVFLISLAIFAWRRYDSRMLVGTAIFLLVVCAALLAGGSERYANDVAIWAYYFLVIGVLGLFIEYLREGHED